MDDFLKTLAWFGIGTFFVIGFAWVFGRAFDTSMDNKDSMLCESAQVSGNVVYLEKCTCYYGGENIRCIYKEIKK